jgi:hypothetical protein
MFIIITKANNVHFNNLNDLLTISFLFHLLLTCVCVCVSLTCNCDLIFLLTLGTARTRSVTLVVYCYSIVCFFFTLSLQYFLSHINIDNASLSFIRFSFLYVNPDCFLFLFVVLFCWIV